MSIYLAKKDKNIFQPSFRIKLINGDIIHETKDMRCKMQNIEYSTIFDFEYVVKYYHEFIGLYFYNDFELISFIPKSSIFNIEKIIIYKNT